MKQEYHQKWGCARIIFRTLAWVLMAYAIPCISQASDAAPLSWRFLSSWPGYLRGEPYGLEIEGDRVFVAMGDSGWAGFDIANAMQPKPLGFYIHDIYDWDTFFTSTEGMDAISNRLYVAEREGGLAIYDVTEPGRAMLLGRYRQKFMDARFVRVEGPYAYLCDVGENGLKVIDITNPQHPALIGQLIQNIWNIKAMDHYQQLVCIIDWNGTFTVVDARDPLHLQIASQMGLGAIDISILDGKAYLAEDEFGLSVFDIDEPASPFKLGSYDFLERKIFPKSVFAIDQKAIVTTRESGLYVIGAQNPEQLELLANTKGLDELLDAKASGSNLCLLSSRDLQILQLTETNSIISKATLPLYGDALAVSVAGSIACLADGEGGLQLLDISDFRQIRLKAHAPLSGPVTDVTVANSHAYVLGGDNALRILDISIPDDPRLVGSLNMPSRPLGLAVTNQIAFLATGTNGLVIVDVRSPDQPRILGSYKTGESIERLKIRGNHAFISEGNQKLVIVDVSDPGKPHSVGSFATSSLSDLDIVDNIVYAISGSRLIILDISDPAKPQLLGKKDILWSSKSIVVDGGLAYISSGEKGVEMIDVRDPRRPFRLSVEKTLGYANRLSVSGGRIFVADGPLGLVVLEPFLNPEQAPVILSPPENSKVSPGEPTVLHPFVGGSLPLRFQWRKNGINIPGATNEEFRLDKFTIADGGTYSLFVSNVNGWVESPPALLAPKLDSWLSNDKFANAPIIASLSGTGTTNNDNATLEVGEPLHAGKDGRKSLWSIWRPSASGVATLSTAGSSLDTLLAVYRGDNLSNLVTIAYDDDRGGYLCSEVQFNAEKGTEYRIAVAGYGLSSVQSVAVQDQVLFVADENNGLLIYDITNPSEPSFLSVLPDEDGPLHVIVKSTYAYLVDSIGLKIVDIHDLDNPEIVGSFDYPQGWIEAIDISRNLAFLAAADNGLIILDTNDPRKPKLIAQYVPSPPWDGWMQDVKVSGAYAYITDLWDGLVILDISNPASPEFISQTFTGDEFSSALNLQVVGPYVFMTTDQPSLEIIDIQNPVNPVQVGYLDELPPMTYLPERMTLQICKTNALITDAEGQAIYVVDITDPTMPKHIATQRNGRNPIDVAVQEGFAYVAGGYSGLLILDIRDPSEPQPIGGMAGSFGNIVMSWNLEVTEETLPIIQKHPESRTLALLGERVELSVEAEPANVSFQWFFNGRPIPGATQPLLIRNPVIPRDAGTYLARITAPNGRAIDSDDAQVEVTAARSEEMQLDSAYKLADLFLVSGGLAPQGFGMAGSPSQGIIGSRWTASSEYDLPAINFQDYGLVATSPRWFSFKPKLSILYTLNTMGSEFRTLLAVFSNRFDLRPIALAIPEGDQTYATLKVPVVSGNEYLVLVASLDGTKGIIQLNHGAPLLVETILPKPTAQVLKGQVFISGPLPEGPYRLETAPAAIPNANWRWMTDIDCHGRIDFLDPEPVNQGSKFYRIWMIPTP